MRWDELRHDRRAALRLYSSSLMSNTKWHTVFEILECVSLNVRQVIVKFSENPNPIAMHCHGCRLSLTPI
jgi:hypothetical protein